MNGENENQNNPYQIVILIITVIFNFLFLLYLSSVISYLIKNYQRKKLCIFWIDYCFLIFGALLFTIIYAIYLFIIGINNEIEAREKTNSPSDLANYFFPCALVTSLTFMCFTLIATLLFDAITAIRLSIKMNKMKTIIKEMDLSSLAKKLNNIDYVDILKMKSHHIYIIIFLVINLILITIEILAYTDVNPERFINKVNLKSFFNYILRIYHFIVLIFLLISIYIMNRSKKSLLKKNYCNPNRIAQKVYDAHFSQIVYFTDVLSFKLVADLIMNIPAFCFLASGKFDAFTMIIAEISMFLYMFFGGSEYFVIDRHSKAGKLGKLIKILFCLKNLEFHFGEKEMRNIMDEFAFDYSQEEKNILKNLNIKIIKNVEYSLSRDENDPMASSSSIELTKSNDIILNKNDCKE